MQVISKEISPHEIVLKLSLIFERHAKGLFGSYFETNEEAVLTNRNCSRTFPRILLGPNGNIQGTPKTIDMRTSVIKKCIIIRILPMPQAVIKYVHDWGKCSARE